MKQYYLRGYFKTISLVGGLVAGIAAMLNFAAGDSSAFLMLIVCVLSIFQYNWATKPYIEIEGTKLMVRLTMFLAKDIDLKEVIKVETPQNKRIILHPKIGKKLTIALNYLTEEDREQILLDIPAIIAGNKGGDLSVHLVSDLK